MIRSLTDLELQAMLDGKARGGLSHSVVAHLRWDLRQILRMAVSKGAADRNAAEQLFIPKSAPRSETRRMTVEEVKLFFSVLDLRERAVGGLAILAGLRPGEILALRRSSLVDGGFADIQQRIYRSELDTPKSHKSRRLAAVGETLSGWLREWVEMLPPTSEDWLFPSETMRTPVSRDNLWRRSFYPRLKKVGMGWANFQVMRRTHASLLGDLDVDPQVRADQMGHGVSVNQNQYTKSGSRRKLDAVNRLQRELGLAE